MAYDPLTPEEVAAIAESYYSECEPEAAAREKPVLVLIGAQPGAGKSAVSNAVSAELSARGGSIHVDADRMREQIDTKGGNPTSQETQPDAGKLATALRALAMENRRNIVEEGTFRNPEHAAAFIDGAKRNGYGIELVALATPREESLVGIFQRYEKQIELDTANPRFVPENYHDEAMQGFEKTVAQNERHLDRVRVTDRAMQTLYDSAAPGPQKHASGLQALQAGQQLTDSKLIEVGKAWEAVRQRAQARSADPAYIESVEKHGQRVEALKGDRTHDFARQNVSTNFYALASDPRFSGHDDATLTKAAYFRGVYQKHSEFQGGQADLAHYDKTMADPDAARRLPDLDGIEQHRTAKEATRSVHIDEGLSL